MPNMEQNRFQDDRVTAPRISLHRTNKPTVIVPTKGWPSLNLNDMWEYRELLYFLVWRNIKVRYKQTVLGAAWAVLQPFLTMVVFSIFFGRLASIPSDGVPYPVFVYAALLPWQLFSYGLTESGNSLVANQHLVAKVYFPRLLIPFSAVLASLVDFGFSLPVFVVIMIYFGIFPTVTFLTLPFFVLLSMVAALAVGLWLSALNVQFRDVRFLLPFITQFWLFVTPIAYPSSLVPEPWRLWYGLNPLVGIVEGFRWALLGQTPSVGPLIIVSCLVIILTLAGGLIYFRRMEKTFPDII